MLQIMQQEVPRARSGQINLLGSNIKKSSRLTQQPKINVEE